MSTDGLWDELVQALTVIQDSPRGCAHRGQLHWGDRYKHPCPRCLADAVMEKAQARIDAAREQTAETIAQAIEGQIYPAHALDGEACEDCLTMHTAARIAREHAKGDGDGRL